MLDEMNEVNEQSKPPASHSPPPSLSPDGSKKSEPTTVTTTDTPAKRAAVQALESASLAAVVEAACCHRNLIPGLAECLETSSLGVIPSRGVSSKNSSSGADKSMELDVGHPILPSIDTLSTTALKLINDFNGASPYVTMSSKDSAPQLKLLDPPMTPDYQGDNSTPNLNIRRRLVVKGVIRGYRMSRATHGVSNGCYYYEAVIGGGENVQSGKKRPLHESSNQERSDPATRQKTGHIRIGWSTRSGDLQAPVGYDEFSYAIRDTGGSRIHKSRREDKWGGVEFGPGDVVGFAICLSGKSSTVVDSGEIISPDTATGNFIRFFINGKQIGDKAFDNVTPGSYYPAVSCYADSSVEMNFGPHFVYPPKETKPVSDLCSLPPDYESVLDTVLSKGNEGKKSFSSKKVDERVAAAFKELVKKEAAIRHDAYLQHNALQKKEVLKLRKERGLPTHDLEEVNAVMEQSIDGQYASMHY